VLPSLRDASFDTPDAVLYPVRDLEVPFQIADELGEKHNTINLAHRPWRGGASCADG
jgi:hypothetical protein